MWSLLIQENYPKKVLDNKSSTFTLYYVMLDIDKAIIDGLACELITLQLIIKNCTSSCDRTYLKENYFVDAKNYPLTIVATIAPITSFGVNSERTSSGEQNKDMDKSDNIVSMHLADDSNDNSYPLNMVIQTME